MVSESIVDINTNVTTNNELFNVTLNATQPSSFIYDYSPYLKVTSITLCILILVFGVIGNIMVPIVILRTKDMRNSTNIFLMNLSLADLLVLLICTPTVLVELNSKPETWVLGEFLCKIIPFVELTVAHASVLTILAITFERYYAICEPLRAGYVCTKARALVICVITWFVAAFCTSPILVITKYDNAELYADEMTYVAVCWTTIEMFWTRAFFVCSITVFFFLPLLTLAILYVIIAKHLMANPGLAAPNSNTLALRYRRQVVLMLGTVVFTFFVCLLPYRALTLWVLFVPYDLHLSQVFGHETFYQILAFCRFMLYLNSAINPILYNLMSSKFRDGFRRVCGFKNGCGVHLGRRGTLTTTSANVTGLTLSSQRTGQGTPPPSALPLTPKKRSLVNLISIESYEKKQEGLMKKLSISSNIIRLQESYV